MLSVDSSIEKLGSENFNLPFLLLCECRGISNTTTLTLSTLKIHFRVSAVALQFAKMVPTCKLNLMSISGRKFVFVGR